MKQRITAEQLQELSQEQRERLREWWRPREFDIFINANGEYFAVGEVKEDLFTCYSDDIFISKQGCLPLFSIGQCIDFLCDMVKDDIFNWFPIPYFANGGVAFTPGHNPELIDGLWTEIKAVL